MDFILVYTTDSPIDKNKAGKRKGERENKQRKREKSWKEIKYW
jgi:hypothetical protein